MDEAADVTTILRRLDAGDERAADDLAPLVHAELHRIAQRALASQRPDHTLQSTALLNEAWIRLVGLDEQDWAGRGHFYAVAAKAMRSVLVDHARRRGAVKRGDGRERVTLDHVALVAPQESIDLIALDDALNELESFDPTLADIVQLRFFGGMTHPEIAAATNAPLRRVERGWRTARAWLQQRMNSE